MYTDRGSRRRIARRSFLKTTGGTAGIGLLAGCLGGESGGDSITIGGLQPYSGQFASYSEPYENGLQFAIDEINADGGVLDRDLAFEGVDTESEPGEAVSIATQLVQEDGAVALVGPVSSDVGITAADTAEDLEVPLFLHTSGTHAVLDKDSRYTYRVGLLPAPTCAQAQAELIEERGYETVGAIIADYAWGRAFEAGLEEFFPDNIDLQMAVAPAGENDFTPYLRNLPGDLEAMFGTGHPPGMNDMYSQMTELGIQPELFTAAVDPPELNYNALGDTATQSFTHIHQPDPYSQEYQEVAQRFYDETGGFFGTTQALGYVTGQLIAEGIRQADSDDPVEISDTIRGIEFETLFAEPIQYTEWGELDQQVQIFSQFESESPEYYPDGEFRLTETYRTDLLDAYDPEELPLD